MSTMRQQLGGDLLNVYGETANRRNHGETGTTGDLLNAPSLALGGDLLNVHGPVATRRGF